MSIIALSQVSTQVGDAHHRGDGDAYHDKDNRADYELQDSWSGMLSHFDEGSPSPNGGFQEDSEPDNDGGSVPDCGDVPNGSMPLQDGGPTAKRCVGPIWRFVLTRRWNTGKDDCRPSGGSLPYGGHYKDGYLVLEGRDVLTRRRSILA